MKLQKLKIHNIASFEDAYIDFEKTPLSDSELFLITGKTGSGKSTILDAICLALYASTPRLENTKMQGATKDKEQKITVSDPRQLLRRNTGEGYVRLSFIGTDRIPYEAEWSVRRARNNAAGNLQSKSWTLKDLTTNNVYTKDSDIRQVMATAIGLTFEQFCRTTMLAQGEFTRFLNSDDKDKAAILEKITGVNVYSEIGAAIYTITSEKLALYRDAQVRADSIEIPSDEEIMALEGEQEQYAILQHTMEGDRQKITAKLSWLQQYATVLALFSEAATALDAANEKTKSQEYEEDRLLVKDWNDSSDARENHIALMAAQQEKARLQQKMQTYKDGFERLRSASGWEADRLAAAKESLETKQSELLATSAFRELYLNEQTVSAYLKSLALAYAGIEQERGKLPALAERLQKSVSLKDEKQEFYNKEENSFDLANEDLKTAEAQLYEYGLPSYRKSSEAHVMRMNMLTTASGAINTYTHAVAVYNETKGQISEIEKFIVEKQKEHEAYIVLLGKAEAAKNLAFEICEKQKAGVDEWAKAVRATLAVNDECPVCRHKVEMLPTEDEVDRIYAIAYDAYRKALKEFDDISAKSNEVAAEHHAFRKQYDSLQDTLKRNVDWVQSSRLAVASALEGLGLVLEEGVENVVKRLAEETQTALSELASKIEIGENMERSVALKRTTLNALREARDKALDALNAAQSAERDAKQLIATAEAVITDKSERAAETVAALEDVIGNLDCIPIDWRVEPAVYQKELQILSEQYLALQRSVSESAQEVQRIQTINDALSQIDAQIIEVMPEWTDVRAEVNAKLDDPLGKANAILADSRTCKAQIEEIINRISKCEGVVSAFLASQDGIDQARLEYLAGIPLAAIATVNRNLDEINSSVIAARSALSEHERSKKVLESEKPQFDESESKDTLEAALNACTEELRLLSENKGAVDQKLKQISENKLKVGHLQEEINGCRAEWEKWDRLNSHFGDATGAKFRKIAQSYVLANLIRAANAYMKTLSDRYTLAVEPGEFVIMVEDAYQGYAHRAVSTISGGESFLVSLSLALALSDIGHTLAVDILFIDEGFGTLSGDPLSKAIDTLKTLHRKSGRKVGIISHVEELKWKVPVLIQVEQDGNSSKSTINII